MLCAISGQKPAAPTLRCAAHARRRGFRWTGGPFGRMLNPELSAWGVSVMADRSRIELEPVRFGERLAASQSFATLFREGMALVEETASYLDGDGRSEAKELQRQAALAYATESMRLTTRLMQIASWLLLHRAVNEGEMSLTQARKEKIKVKIGAPVRHDDEMVQALPPRLQELVERSIRMETRVRRLDITLHAPEQPPVAGVNPVERQLGLLKAAFSDH